MPPRRRLTIGIAISGTLLVTAYAVLAALQIIVLNPLAAVPSATLREIHAEMARMGESPGIPVTIGILGLGVLLAGGLLALFAGRADATPFAAATAHLLMLVLGAPAYFVASFGPGMALADTFLISGADYVSWAFAHYATSGIALLALLGAIAIGSARSDPTKRAPATA
ncbi:hypothetical protein [Microbacterium immunditiarum]|uniref:Uncharacterized protein n=1 Tax=Microbacterium immunditiarum TaxID=337480 RepID=A0A7Y9KM38_9MICO|nr:hypothetical protein [Microbacterium immunditiarum]NYE20409.1 hypothetical protein [Microbacterium immunditiarum]